MTAIATYVPMLISCHLFFVQQKAQRKAKFYEVGHSFHRKPYRERPGFLSYNTHAQQALDDDALRASQTGKKND